MKTFGMYNDEQNIINDFIQAEPNFNSEPSKETIVKIFYDDRSLYIGVELIDELSNIKQKNAIYDDWHEGFDNNSDYFVVEIDSEHNHQQSFVSPLIVQVLNLILYYIMITVLMNIGIQYIGMQKQMSQIMDG